MKELLFEGKEDESSRADGPEEEEQADQVHGLPLPPPHTPGWQNQEPGGPISALSPNLMEFQRTR